MNRHLGERARLGAVVVAAAVVVVVFAGIQYRWSNEIREAASVRLGDTLQLSMVNWHLDLLRNFSEISLALRVPDAQQAPTAEHYMRAIEGWRAIARYPGLLSAVYVVHSGAPGDLVMERLAPATGEFEQVDSSHSLGPLQHALNTLATSQAVLVDREPSADHTLTGTLPIESYYRLGEALNGWRFEPGTPALVHAIAPSRRAGPFSGSAKLEQAWLVVELNEPLLRTRVLPDLAHRYFQGTEGLDYEVAVVTGGQPRRVLYQSDPGFGDRDVDDADGTVNLFGRGQPGKPAAAIRVFHTPEGGATRSTPTAIPWFALLRNGGVDDDWQLVVRHRRGGPLSAFVSGTYRRYLGLSFGALLLLAISMAMVIVTSNRAHRLAKLQMDFVTAVSHELRTPLTVIGSAADNIAQGVVSNEKDVAQYGAVIAGQVRQLSGLVEQVLEFAATNEGRRAFTLGPVDVGQLVDATLASTAGLIQAEHFTVERDVDAGLPAVSGDLVALSQCLQNLITNALKYGRAHRWVGIRARLAGNGSGREVQVSVSDRGIGIDPAEISQVFEPFYRSPQVKDAHIRGTGLGLSVAKRLADAMGGHLSVTSTVGRGSTFTLHLPCADTASTDANA